MSIVQSAEALIGNTPLLKLNRLFPGAEIYAKLESKYMCNRDDGYGKGFFGAFQ